LPELFAVDAGHGEQFVAEGLEASTTQRTEGPSSGCHERPDRRRRGHSSEDGLGSAVVAGLLNAGVQQRRLAHLSVSELPGSGTTAELLPAAGIPRTSHRQPPR
jgi:hypothetical protein